VVKYLKGRNPPVNDLEGNINIESDCDGDVPEAGDVDESLSTREENGEIRAVLITGSFSAYVNLLLPLCFIRNDNLPAGNPSSSTVAQTRSYLLP
jgi:hypothetical protein